MTIRNISMAALTFMAAFFIGSFTASAIPDRPEPERLVNDFAGLLTSGQIAVLENELVAFDDSTSNQITVVTVRDLEGYDAAEYATRIGLEWGVGSAEFDNGVIILVKPKTTSSGEVFIAVGYGLEGAIPDAYAKRIINNEMIPHFMQDDYYGGIHAACTTLMKLASGEISAAREYEEDGNPLLFIIFIIAIIIIFIAISKNDKGGSGNGGNGGRRIYMGPMDFGGWGGSSRGGSFGGGFGGFGGGSFGGGGAGGKW